MLASCHWLVVADETQPLRSVRAVARPKRPTRMGRVKAFILMESKRNVKVQKNQGYLKEKE